MTASRIAGAGSVCTAILVRSKSAINTDLGKKNRLLSLLVHDCTHFPVKRSLSQGISQKLKKDSLETAQGFPVHCTLNFFSAQGCSKMTSQSHINVVMTIEKSHDGFRLVLRDLLRTGKLLRQNG